MTINKGIDIELNENLLQHINTVLPNHLWIGHNWTVQHIDNPFFERVYRYASDHTMKLIRYGIGYITTITFPEQIGTDALYISIYESKQSCKPLYQFLKEVRGDVEEYKDIIILITGENPWK